MKDLEIGDLIVNTIGFKNYRWGTTFRVVGFGDISLKSDPPKLGYCITQNEFNLEYISDDEYKTNFVDIKFFSAELKNITRDNKIVDILS